MAGATGEASHPRSAMLERNTGRQVREGRQTPAQTSALRPATSPVMFRHPPRVFRPRATGNQAHVPPPALFPSRSGCVYSLSGNSAKAAMQDVPPSTRQHRRNTAVRAICSRECRERAHAGSHRPAFRANHANADDEANFSHLRPPTEETALRPGEGGMPPVRSA